MKWRKLELILNLLNGLLINIKNKGDSMDLNTLVSNYSDFLYFYKKSYPNSLFHNSNVFHRDIQYVLTEYIKRKENKMLPVGKSEELATQLEFELEKKGVLKRLNHKSWVLNYPDLMTPKKEKK